MNSTVKFVAVLVASLISIGSAFAASDAQMRSACKRLYVGKAVTFFDSRLEGVVTGIGEKEASVKITKSETERDIGRVAEFYCTFLLNEN